MNIKTAALLACTMFVLIACDNEPRCERYITDQKLRAERFDKCLSTVMDGRKSQSYATKHDEDLEDVVDECDTTAYYQAQVINPLCQQ